LIAQYTDAKNLRELNSGDGDMLGRQLACLVEGVDNPVVRTILLKI